MEGISEYPFTAKNGKIYKSRYVHRNRPVGRPKISDEKKQLILLIKKCQNEDKIKYLIETLTSE